MEYKMVECTYVIYKTSALTCCKCEYWTKFQDEMEKAGAIEVCLSNNDNILVKCEPEILDDLLEIVSYWIDKLSSSCKCGGKMDFIGEILEDEMIMTHWCPDCGVVRQKRGLDITWLNPKQYLQPIEKINN